MIFEKFNTVKNLIFDVDGVFTDSNILVTDDGEFLRIMNVRDGYAIKRIIAEKFHVAVITGGRSPGVTKRLKGLGIEHVYSGISNKIDVLKKHLADHQLDPQETLFMGDDLVDLDCLSFVGFPVCPHDATPEVIEVAEYISPVSGGKGCVRDVVEKIMHANNTW